MDDFIRPLTFVAIRLPSGLHKIVKVVPDTVISLGKFGSFNSCAILERPFYVTFEILDQASDTEPPELRIVPAQELHAETLSDDISAAESRDDAPDEEQGAEVVEQDGQVIVRNNRQTVDDSTRQSLSMTEIEQLKKSAVSSGKDIVTKIMESHSALGEKTAYSLAKYIVRKTKKFMKRFTVLPLDVSTLAHYMINERDASKILEIREEMLGLVASWSNVHFSIPMQTPGSTPDINPKAGRWLVVDDAAGLFVALLAERMGILHPREPLDKDSSKTRPVEGGDEEDDEDDGADTNQRDFSQVSAQDRNNKKREHPEDEMDVDSKREGAEQQPPFKRTRPPPVPEPMPADHNTITLVHTATQPNLSLLTFFSYDANANTSNIATEIHDHPLYNNLKTLSWLQLLSPEEDTTCAEPEPLSETQLSLLKSSKRGAYYRKRRRWERARHTVDETRAGGFDGLVVATTLDLAEVMHALVPLLRGGAPIAVFSPHAEPLVELADQCSSQRRTAFINALYDDDDGRDDGDGAGAAPLAGSADFPFDPRLVLAPCVQTVRAREWQVLPGRTHPKMTSLGGPEGYLFTGIRAIPSEDRAEARGVFSKKKKKRPEAADGGDMPAPR